MPKNFSTLYMQFIKGYIDGEFGLLEKLFYSIAGKTLDKDEDEIEGETRRLSRMTYNIEVENKYGKKVKYSNDKNDFEFISKGTKSQENESGDTNIKQDSVDKTAYIHINLILLILFLFL